MHLFHFTANKQHRSLGAPATENEQLMAASYEVDIFPTPIHAARYISVAGKSPSEQG